jgi:hypothetical protein
MNNRQRDFYEKNVKSINNLRRDGNDKLSIQLETVNQLLKKMEVSKALQWAEHYCLPQEFILDIKEIFCGFND